MAESSSTNEDYRINFPVSSVRIPAFPFIGALSQAPAQGTVKLDQVRFSSQPCGDETLLGGVQCTPRVERIETRITRSEERRGGNECVGMCRSRWAQGHEKNKHTEYRKATREIRFAHID